MSEPGSTKSKKNKMKGTQEDDSEEELWDSEEDDETIARIQRAHFAQAASANSRKRAAPKPRRMSQKRKLEAVRTFHDFTKKLKKDTGIRIRGLVGNDLLELSDFSSDDGISDSDGLSEEEFNVDPSAVQELNDENESYIDPETGDFVEAKKTEVETNKCDMPISPSNSIKEEPKTLSISDIINEGDLDLTKNVEIAEVEGSELCVDKTPEELLNIKQEDNSQDFDITEKLKEMGEISVKPIKKETEEENSTNEDGKKPETDEEKKPSNPNALNVRRNIRDVMNEKNLDASTLTAQRQESERLARVQEQQRIIREVQRQIAINRQNKIHQKTLSLLQGGSSILKKLQNQKPGLSNTVLMKLSGDAKKTPLKHGQIEVTKLLKPTTSAQQKGSEKKEVVEIVDSSSGDESSSSSSAESHSDDCIILSDSDGSANPDTEDPGNSGLHVKDAYNIPDEQGRVLINIGHPESEEDIFVAPQIARIIKPHQIGGVRFLFDNIIESVERFSTSTGFGCILAHSMGLGKTLQIVCFCDIFLRHTGSKTVLCIMPINTLQNWVAEFNMWLPVDATNSPLAAHGEVRPRNFPIYVLNDSHKTLQMRAKVVKDWQLTGGVLMIGYELYRLLSMKKDKKPRKKKKPDPKDKDDKEKEKDDKKSDKTEVINEDTQGSDMTSLSKVSEESKQDKEDVEAQSKVEGEVKDDTKKEDTPTDEEKKLLDEMYEALVKPGPDLVICDEGHRIKNSHSNISYALKQMRTKRRVVLTGYPLQNNLLEYWCMVDFVRPNYLGSKTEFCNMFERPIQNGQCIDSTPQDIKLMRYRAHVLHSLLVGFVQRRSHAVLQSTLPQKEEYVLLVRMTPLQRKLYDRFMNEVVRSTSVPNPLKAFAICCKIWNHPDVLYNFLRKRYEANTAIEEDLDLEEIGGVTKTGRSRSSRAPPRKPAKPRGSSKKPAATIPPNVTTPVPPRQDMPFGNQPYPQNGPYGPPPSGYGPNTPGGPYPPYPNYQNTGSGYYPPNQGYNQNYDNNYYPQQQQSYTNNYPNQYPQNNPDPNQTYNQNYWGNGNYYGDTGFYNNPQFPNNQPPQDYTGNAQPAYNNQQQYPQTNQPILANAAPPYENNQQSYDNQQKPYQTPYPNQPGYTEFNTNAPPQTYPNNQAPPTYPNNQAPPTYPNNQTPSSYPNNQAPPTYPNQPYPPPYPGNSTHGNNQPIPFNQFDNRQPNYPTFPDTMAAAAPIENSIAQPSDIKHEPVNFPLNEPKPGMSTYENQNYTYNQPNSSHYSDQSEIHSNGNYPSPFSNFPNHIETKPPLGSGGSGSPLPSWPLTDTLKTEVDRLKAEEKTEVKSESDGEFKIEDLDTKKIVKDDVKDSKKETEPLKESQFEVCDRKDNKDYKKSKTEGSKSGESESEDEVTKKKKPRSRKKDTKKVDKPERAEKLKPKSKSRAKGRKDRKNSKDKNNDDSESEESEKEEKLNREEELALVKKAEEMTYDWAAELLKDYIPGLIENSAKMELFFYILNESIKLGDRILLFSQSLFTLNLIEDFLERNYIPGTNTLWKRNTSYYRLDGSTHALEREKLINEFNANPNIYLFLVSTRAGSLGINLVGANRVIVFDASWNPCHDTQAVCRVYRYGQKKPCFVYRFVMDWCLEKKIYDRQINKQGMADRVVDECNPDAVLSMKEITNLCFDNDEKECEIKDLSEFKDRYIDVLMQGIITQHGKLLSKEPFQHESLLVDRKEKKLSIAEKRQAQRSYEHDKKMALAPKPTTSNRTVRMADGTVVQRPVASVRPMQHGPRWIPADVWRRQGMTAQEMTLPLDVVIPTNSAEKTNVVLKAGQRVMVLKSPKGIYMQLESGKIIAIKTAFKGQKGDKDIAVGKKVLGGRPTATNIPGSLKNNSAITITSKSGARPGFNRVIRPVVGHNKMTRPVIPAQRVAEIRNRMAEMRSYSAAGRARLPVPGKILRPNLPGSVSITKISKKPDIKTHPKSDSKMDMNSDDDDEDEDDEDDDAEILDSDGDERVGEKNKVESPSLNSEAKKDIEKNDEQPKPSFNPAKEQEKPDEEIKNTETKPLVLTTDEKLPSEDALDNKTNKSEETKKDIPNISKAEALSVTDSNEKKVNLLKNYRHPRQVGNRSQTESSLSQLERTASSLSKESMPYFRKNLDDITQSYSPENDEKPTSKSKKKKSPNKLKGQSDVPNIDTKSAPHIGMSHSVSNLLGSHNNPPKPRLNDPSMKNTAPISPLGRSSAGSLSKLPNMPSAPEPSLLHGGMGQNIITNIPSLPQMPINMSQSGNMAAITSVPSGDISKMPPLMPNIPQTTTTLPGNPPLEETFGQFPPGYGMPYGAYPNTPYYAGAYGTPPYYPPYGTAPSTNPPVQTPNPENYLPPNPQW